MLDSRNNSFDYNSTLELKNAYRNQKRNYRKGEPIKTSDKIFGNMTMWQSGGMGGHGSQNNPWIKLMGIVHKERGRGHADQQNQNAISERAQNQLYKSDIVKTI
ncbi:hypothetical protein Bhyg_11490 [Pseudolycoriella hygida]|uniref:Uncharacterized protein n=1 Tax=Pseudolycoriella hygida TaxID=35572 RepID=A0A9Q0MVH3_9DIPT|nr:hypothetical protein Bhyg_11490 [Pseudolycoriella hygida]